MSDRFESPRPPLRHHVALVLCLWASSATTVRAVGPAWIAEMSSQEGNAARADTIDVWLPAGEFVTVAVHDAEEIEVGAPPSMRAEAIALADPRVIVVHVAMGYGHGDRLPREPRRRRAGDPP